MPLLRVNRRPSRVQLMLFAAVWMGLAVLLRGRALAHQRETLAAVLRIAAVVPVLALAFGWEGLRRLYVGACHAAYPLGWVVSHLALAGVYYLVFTPAGWLLRRFGHDPLQRQFDPRAASYWQRRPPAPRAAAYFRQS